MNKYAPSTHQVLSYIRGNAVMAGASASDAQDAAMDWLAEVERAAAEKAFQDAWEWINANFQSLPRWKATWESGTRSREYERGSVDALCDVRDWLRAGVLGSVPSTGEGN